MIASTTFTIDDYDITETKGLVRGIVVRSPTITQGILGGLKNIIGGKIGSYTKMCEQTRSQAYEDMVAHAKALGANAIVGVRYDASSVAAWWCCRSSLLWHCGCDCQAPSMRRTSNLTVKRDGREAARPLPQRYAPEVNYGFA